MVEEVKMSESINLDNVLMQQSNGPKATMPEARPVAELLVVLNEFNKYELYTGTGDGVQPIVADGSGTSNISFDVPQENASSFKGTFVYFDNDTNTWHPAYAVANPSLNEHYTAQGIAVAIDSTSMQVTTSGKLTIPFQLKDYTGTPVTAGTYYYLCQDSSNAGMIQPEAPASGIKQVVCQIMSVDETQTTLLLLNDVSQIAEDILVTSGDGSKYLGDDGQYHAMLVAGLAGRTANCIADYEVLDIEFDNIEAGSNNTTAFTFPALTANGTASNSPTVNAVNNTFRFADGTWSTMASNGYLMTTGTDVTFAEANADRFDLRWFSVTAFSCAAFKITNNSDATKRGKNLKSAVFGYNDGQTWKYPGFTVVNPTDEPGATSIIRIPYDIVAKVGLQKSYNLVECKNFDGESTDFTLNLVQPMGLLGAVTNPTSFGYVPNGDIQINENIASGFSEANYIISKYLIEGNSQWSFRVRQKFSQVTNIEPICSAPNTRNYLAVENGVLRFVLNGVSYLGNLEYQPDTWYDFRVTYDLESGYMVSSSTNGGSTWTNEIAIYDEQNYLSGLSVYLGVRTQMGGIHDATSGEIDLAHTGFDYLDNDPVISNYPISNLTNKSISTITVTAKINGITAQGRASDTNTLLAQTVSVDTKKNTVIAGDHTDLVWDAEDGLTTSNYVEVDYYKQYEEEEEGTILYAKDTNLCYRYTVIYPNFLQTNVQFETDERTYIPNVIQYGNPTISNAAVVSGLSALNKIQYPYTFNPGTKPWSRVVKFTTPADMTASGQIIGSPDELHEYNYIELSTSSASHFTLWLGSTGASADITNECITGSYTILTSTTYWVKIEYDGVDTYTLSYSTNGTSFTPDITVTSELHVGAGQQMLGCDRAKAFTGSIDLVGCIDTIDGQTTWTGAYANPNINDTLLNMSDDNAMFHPNKFLNRNGFNFNLKLDLNGNLKLYRTLDARNYGSTASHPFYYAVQGVDWSTFVKDGNYKQGVKISSYLGTTNTGTGANSIYSTTVDDATYWYGSPNSQVACAPCFLYTSFENPVRFDSVLFRGAGSANYLPEKFCLHVSNDMNTWYNIIPSTTAGLKENGQMGNLPMTYAPWTLTTINGYLSQPVQMPDDATYWKYVRLGLWTSKAYIPEISGFWIGADNRETSLSTATAQTATELIFEKTNFFNTENSGINVDVVKKKIGTAYQVRFLDKLGWVVEDDSQAVVDSTGKKLAPNAAEIFEDTRLQQHLDYQTLAYQVHCKQYLRNDKSNGYGVARNPFNTTNGNKEYVGCATVGTVSNSFNLLQDTTTGYAFENGANECDYIISFMNRAKVGKFFIQNYATTGYTSQLFKVYGSIDGGYVEGTTNMNDGDQAAEAIWEEVPIMNIVNVHNGEFNTYAPTQQQNTFVDTANLANHASGTVSEGDYGAYEVYVAPAKAYHQYKIVFQRTINNSVTMMTVLPQDVWFDPWATPVDESGTNLPILVDTAFFTSSSSTVLPDKETLTQAMYTSPYSPETVFQLYQTGNNLNWTPGNNRNYVYLQQAYQYPVNMSQISVQHGSDLNYAANLFEYYGTDRTSYAQQSISDENPLSNWTRLTSLQDKSDMPTSLSVANKTNTLVLGRKEYGYSYFTALFARTLNNSIYMDGFRPNWVSCYNTDNNKNTASIYTQEWKWTNVKGNAGDIRTATCYDHPMLQTGETHILYPSYVVTKRGEDTKYYTDTEAPAGANLDDGVAVFRTTSMVGNKTVPYENRWMYQYEDLAGDTWYSNTSATGGKGTNGSYMYKNIIPKYNKEFYTGIPLTATADTGSDNGYEYFASPVPEEVTSDVSPAFNAFSSSIATGAASYLSGAVFNPATGVSLFGDIYVGFKAPNPICVQGYTIGAIRGTTSMLGIAQWRFQGSNDGESWTTLDTRNTERTENPDIPVNLYAGSTYYFNNEESYTHYRWIIDKMVPGSNFIRFNCFGLFVLEENPFLVRPIYQLERVNAAGETLIAYTYDEGTSGVNIANDTTVWTDVKWTEPVENIWAYEVTDNANTYWVNVPGNSGAFVPEATMVYVDYDFNEEYLEALVDTWTYTGNINKKFAYTGARLQDFTWDREEPYNKYVYTGEIANQYKYTGKIEGWAYTGVTEDIYDTVPNFHLSLNRDDARTITKKTSLGMAYPVTNTETPDGTSFYSYSAGDIPGAIVPEGTPLYSGIDDTTSTATADGTDAYIFSTAPAESRYEYSHLYVRNNEASDGTTLTADAKAFYDVNLTEPVSDDVDLTQYYYDSERAPSHMTDFYHRITEDTPAQNYNFGLSFDGSGYTFNCYKDGGTTDIQQYTSDEPVKSSYQGAANETKDTVVLIARHQDLAKINLTKSVYGWWTWNGLAQKVSQQTTANIFRLGKISADGDAIESIYALYPWRISESSEEDNIKYLLPDGKKKTVKELTLVSEEDSASLQGYISTMPLAPVPLPANSLASGTSHTFTSGGYVMCLSPMTVTLWSGNSPMQTVFSSFCGVLPIPWGCVVKTSATAYFGDN